MLKKTLPLLILTMFFAFACSQKTETTSAKLKINLSKIVNMNSGIGAGGAILFGKSASGEQFGKVISGLEENLELPNGDWSFYSFMWEKSSDTMMEDVVYCGKSAQKLNGTAATIALNLNNTNCAEEIYSGNDSFQLYKSGVGMKRTFAKFTVEECDDLNGTGFTCLKKNQGSAVTYRFVFKSYKRAPNGEVVFSNESIKGACLGPTDTTMNGLRVNFPSGNSAMPFIASVETYLGSPDCGNSVPETKGVYTHNFMNGIGTNTLTTKALNRHGYSCQANATTEDLCLEYFGTWSAGTCNYSSESYHVNNFAPESECKAGTIVTPTDSTARYIKQMVSIPKSFLCRFNDSLNTGVSSFPGGDGSPIRPFKICNEWQLNQIGEMNTQSSSYDTFNYKLMNDLDMNKASNVSGFSIFPAPVCAGASGTEIDYFHNLNPLDGHLCGAGVTTSNAGFIGVFDGAGHSISNGRISADNLAQMGFVRLLGTREISGQSGVIRNLNFKNLSVRGTNYVGSVAGESNGIGKIQNVKIEKVEVEGDQNVGGLVSLVKPGFIIENVQLRNARVRGVDYVGGLVGNNEASISKSMFSGLVTTENNSTSYFSGGVAGFNAASGVINSSFSEGFISSFTQYVGGVTSKNYGNISDVYSTMAMTSLRNDPSTVSIGGIAAFSDGNISNCFSDTRKMYVGGATVNYSGTILSGSGTFTNCLTDLTNSSSNNADTYSNLRTNSVLGPTFVSFGGGNWILGQSDGGIPRLSWESRECLLADNLLSVQNQVTNLGRGTGTNPIVICTNAQLLSINGRSSAENYRLADSINISPWVASAGSTTGITTFNGKFNGGGNALYGMDINIDNVSDNNVGIFKTISANAVVSNLDLYANRVYTSSDSVSGVGILSNVNNGTISNVHVFASSVIGTQQLGIVTVQNTNSGLIKDVRINGAHIVGDSYVGSVAYQNTGLIDGVSSTVNFGSSVASFAFGGIVGQNNPLGVIEQATVRGEFNLTNGYPRNVGGIAGVNYGTVNNTYVGSDMKMSLAITASSEAIGGIVGSNESGATLSRSFFLGKIIGTQSSSDLTSNVDTDSSTDEREIGPIIGKNNGGSTLWALAISDYLLWGQSNNTVSSCDSGSNTITLSTTPGGSSNALSYHRFPFLVPFTTAGNVITLTGLSLNGQCPSSGDSVDLYESYHNYAEFGTTVPISDFSSIAAFSAQNFSIALGDSPGVIGYHMAKTYNMALPTSTPVWVMDSGDDHPKLLRVDH